MFRSPRINLSSLVEGSKYDLSSLDEIEKLATKKIVRIEDKRRNYRTMAGSYKNKKNEDDY